MRLRLGAVWRCAKYGLLPWWLYENEPHYDCGYLAHLAMNARYAARWATGRETEADIAFEQQVNRRTREESGSMSLREKIRRYCNGEPLPRVIATALILKIAEAIWFVGDRVCGIAERVDDAGESVSDIGHHLLDAWADRNEIAQAQLDAQEETEPVPVDRRHARDVRLPDRRRPFRGRPRA